MGRCAIWGVLNVTPDSFSDGGQYTDPETACRHGRSMLLEGADVIDVGGESSRPAGQTYGQGAGVVDTDEELRRVVPVIGRLVSELGAKVSVDTVKPEVARAAVAAGASIINDISCGGSTELLKVAGNSDVDLVLMHNRGRGEVSGDNVNYGDVARDVIDELMVGVERAMGAGVSRGRIWIDPGIGFAKTAEQSTKLVAETARFVETGFSVLVGPSRKSFIARMAPAKDGTEPSPDARQGGTAAAVTVAVLAGAHAVRVHDVAPMWQTVRLAEALRARSKPTDGRN